MKKTIAPLAHLDLNEIVRLACPSVCSKRQHRLMKTGVQTPMDVFYLLQHLLGPLFQRPYGWDEDDQCGPLRQDIRRMAIECSRCR